MLEPDVALTDLLLAAESASLAWLLSRHPASPARPWLVCLLAAIGAAALLGFVEHGLVADKAGLAERITWSATLLAVGAAGLAAWGAGARLALAAGPARRTIQGAAVAFAGYGAAVLLGARAFGLAIAFYLPAVLFLGWAFRRALARGGERRLRAGLAGLGLSLVAAGLQQARVGLPAAHLDHNAVYHLVQAVALLLLYRGAAAAPPAPVSASAP